MDYVLDEEGPDQVRRRGLDLVGCCARANSTLLTHHATSNHDGLADSSVGFTASAWN